MQNDKGEILSNIHVVGQHIPKEICAYWFFTTLLTMGYALSKVLGAWTTGFKLHYIVAQCVIRQPHGG